RLIRDAGLTSAPPGRPRGVVARDGGAGLRAARERLGISQSQLATQIGATSATISQLEGIWGFGVSAPVASRLSRRLGLALDDVFCDLTDVPSYLIGERSTAPTPKQENGRAVGKYAQQAVHDAERYCAASGLLTQKQAAAFLDVSVAQVHYYAEEGL